MSAICSMIVLKDSAPGRRGRFDGPRNAGSIPTQARRPLRRLVLFRIPCRGATVFKRAVSLLETWLTMKRKKERFYSFIVTDTLTVYTGKSGHASLLRSHGIDWHCVEYAGRFSLDGRFIKCLVPISGSLPNVPLENHEECIALIESTLLERRELDDL